ncbi:MAG: Brp/Blh family beta-carotene 15,15'-dioxygenase [Bacteroidota bacterium]
MLTLLVSLLPASELITSIVGILLIVLVGIPHGATDHVLFNVMKGQSIEEKPQRAFLGQYLLVIAAYGVMWWILPSLALLLFLAVSAYHFGEAQLRYLSPSWMMRAASFLWGGLVLMIILFVHLPEVKPLLVPFLIQESVWFFIEQNAVVISGVTALLLIATLVLCSGQAVMKELPELLILAVITWNSPLLLSFAIFFVFWHSVDAVKSQISKIRLSEGSFDLRRWIKLSTPFTALSLVGIGGTIAYGLYFGTSLPLLTVFFVLIALITLPHAIVMSRFYRF